MAKCKPFTGAPVCDLQLTQAEADTLVDILHSIGGPPAMTRRKHADAVCIALMDAGIEGLNRGDSTDIDEDRDAIYFTASRRPT